ncbi:MAG: response regulator transcription factor [Microbacteriaceae bacterium]
MSSAGADAVADIRVLVADDHPVVRSGIAGLLAAASGITVVGEASDGVEAVERARELLPDLVLMDLRMPRLGGADATAQITAALPDTRVLILTTYETDDLILGAIEAGASGYLLKAAPAEEILAGVRSIVGGQTVLAPAIAAKLVQRVRAADAAADAASTAAGSGGDAAADERPRLSNRELEELRLVADGLSNPSIARELFIGEATVKTHLLHVFEKLGVSDRTRAVTLALELGLL